MRYRDVPILPQHHRRTRTPAVATHVTVSRPSSLRWCSGRRGLTGIGRRSAIPGTFCNCGVSAPTARSSMTADSRLMGTTGRTSRTGIARQDPHAPQPRSHADPPLGRHNPSPPRHRGDAAIPIVQHDPHPSYGRYHPIIVGSFARFPGWSLPFWVRLHAASARRAAGPTARSATVASFGSIARRGLISCRAIGRGRCVEPSMATVENGRPSRTRSLGSGETINRIVKGQP